MTARAYYNEIDPYAAQWLRNLISAGHIAPGDVDERSIVDVQPDDLKGYNQCHFFAGIGGWSVAARLAGWPDDTALWTGSCPCQPFSDAGKGHAFTDERHLWPAFFALIRAVRPPVVMGEQVASQAGLAWFDDVHLDLESEGYAIRAADLCAAGVGAPHIRQRLYWVAHTARHVAQNQPERDVASDKSRKAILVGSVPGTGSGSTSGHYAARDHGSIRGSSIWSRSTYRTGLDGRNRPTEPGALPLAHGVPARVGKLRAYGNAIVPQVAAEVIGAYMDATNTSGTGGGE